MAENLYPLHASAVVLPVLAFPAWILDIPPMIWHFSQRNISAGSLILWLILINLANTINPLIWPRDNVLEWWDGNVYCDIQSRIEVGASVGLAACTLMIVRKLAKVMDTHNITVAPSKSSRAKEKALEIIWCWVYPMMMMVIYYIVQPARYFIFGISGCGAIYDSSWPSLVLIWMWDAIFMCIAAFYAGLLIFRLWRYRREFHRLVSARNSTKSRFLRLFFMAAILILLYLPYSFFLLYKLAMEVVDDYSWNRVHGPSWNSIIKVPVAGHVRLDKWGQVATGYLIFFLFGTGTDAHNTYKKMLCAIGLGKIFPSLYVLRESGTSTPSSLTFVSGWASTWSSKAKNLFSRNGSIAETVTMSNVNRNNSAILASSSTNPSLHLQPISTSEPMLQDTECPTNSSPSNRSFMSRLFTRRNRNHQAPVLPIFTTSSVDEMTLKTDKSPADSVPPGVYARAWATDGAASGTEVDGGVHVVRELHQDHYEKKGKGKEGEGDDWA